MNLPRVRLTAGSHPLDVYVARDDEERSLGLMFRREMPPDEGMLFVCDAPAYQSFWMKDTPLPLSIAFIEENGTIVQIDHMQPQTLDAHRSQRPVRYILEVNQGWFDERGVAEGTRLEGPLFLSAQSS
jgi:uncharacterized membrane protein (UPF0127 family)